MKRRQLLAGLGVLGAGGSAIVGSGAFASAEAERAVTVETASDDDAYLRLTKGDRPTDDRSFRADGMLRFRFPGLREGLEHESLDTNPENPEGLGTDTVYRFATETDGSPLFNAENQGTEPIEIHSRQATTENVPTVRIFNVKTQRLLTAAQPSGVLDPGERIPLGLEIDTTDATVGETFTVPLTIVAESTA